MRCTDAIIAAFLAHPKYCRRKDFIQTGVDSVVDKKSYIHFNHWAFANYLPTDAARRALKQCLPDIIRRQLSTGLWGRKLAEKKSYDILKALKHSGMIEDIINKGTLRYDPYKNFYESKDFYGLLVRTNIIGKGTAGDPVLKRQFISQITQAQGADGSWEGTVMATYIQIEKLLELGLGADDSRIVKGVKWILSQFRESVERRQRRNPLLKISVKSMFTGEDCEAEFLSALKWMPEWDPKDGCFVTLPLIQTAFALRILVRLGFGSDERVLKGYNSLLEIQILPGEDGGDKLSAGRWCSIACRRVIEDRIKPGRKAK